MKEKIFLAGAVRRWRPLFVAAVALIGLCRPAAATAPTDDAALARRIAAIASIAADEYALGRRTARYVAVAYNALRRWAPVDKNR